VDTPGLPAPTVKTNLAKADTTIHGHGINAVVPPKIAIEGKPVAINKGLRNGPTFFVTTNSAGEAVTNNVGNDVAASKTKSGDDDEETKDESTPSVDITLEETWRILQDLVDLTKGQTFATTRK
jgi:hypothetical protein